MKHSISAGGRIPDLRRSRRLPLTLLRTSLTLLLLALTLVLIAGCAGRDIPEQPPVPAASLPPGLQHSGTQKQFHSFESAELTFHFTITNPGPDTLQLHSYRYRLEEIGQPTSSGPEPGSDSDVTLDPEAVLEPDRSPIVSGRQKLVDHRVPAGGSSSMEVPIQLPLGEPKKGPQPPDKPAELRYRLVVEARADSGVNENIQLTSEVNGTLPLPQLPQVRIPEVVIAQFKTHTIDIEYKVEISNPNSFPILLSTAEYTFSVRKAVWDKGALPQRLQIPPESSRSVSKPMLFNYLKAGRKTVDTLIGGKSIDYRITGAAAALPTELPAQNRSSESTMEAGLAKPVPYSFSFELEETSALIRP